MWVVGNNGRLSKNSDVSWGRQEVPKEAILSHSVHGPAPKKPRGQYYPEATLCVLFT